MSLKDFQFNLSDVTLYRCDKISEDEASRLVSYFIITEMCACVCVAQVQA